MEAVKANIKNTRYATTINAAGNSLTADESAENGGQALGFTPSELLAASLAACTSITLRMYADRKGWALTGAAVDLKHYKDGDRSKIERVLHLTGDLDGTQRARLADIAERTPVTLTLKGGADIATTLAEAAA